MKQEELRSLRVAFIERFGNESISIEELTLPTADGVSLDAIRFQHPLQRIKPASEQRWVLFVLPNGATIEEMLFFFRSYSNDAGVSLLAFNYRGVGGSKGRPVRAADLVADAEAAFDRLIRDGVKSEHILIHGHSLGGGVGALVRAKHPEGPIISDRSFRSFAATAAEVVSSNTVLKAITNTLIGTVTGVLPTALLTDCNSRVVVLAASAVSVFLLYQIPSVPRFLLTRIVKWLGWELNVLDVWKQIRGHKLVLYHPLDGVIAHEGASLFRALEADPTQSSSPSMPTGSSQLLQQQQQQQHHNMKLSYSHLDGLQTNVVYHCYSLDMDRSEWREIIQHARRGLSMSLGER